MPHLSSFQPQENRRQKVAPLFRLAIGLLSSAVLASAAHAASLQTFLSKLPADNDAQFLSKNVVDLSLYQTMSKWQPPLGSCTTFSLVAAVESAFTKKYCEQKTSAFYKKGYCQRYEAIKAEQQAGKMPPFFLADSKNWWSQSDKKALDLSEQYFLDRVLSMWSASPTSGHESGNLFCFLDGIERGVAGDVTFIVNNLHLPEENDVPYIYDGDFYNQAQAAVCTNITQEKIDSYHFSETLFKMKNWDNSDLTRMFLPHAGYQNAVYGVSDLFFAETSSFGGSVLKILEKTLYAGYPIAISGAQQGHSMLLIGYDRTKKLFLFKDHYQRWVTVNYDDLAKTIYEMTVILDVKNDYLVPSKEEMWLGPWDMDLDGRVGKLVIRRTRIPSNALYTDDSVSTKNLTAVPTSKWARIGTFYEATGSQPTKRTVYGRLNNSDGTTMELNIDFGKVEGPADPLSQIAIGYSPTGQSFQLRMFTQGSGTASYASGTAVWQGKPYGVLLSRPSSKPYLGIPNTPATQFNRNQWVGQFTVVMEGGTLRTLELKSDDGLKTLVGTISGTASEPTAQVVGKFIGDNHVQFNTQGAMPGFYFELFYHTWEKGVLSGTLTQIMNTVSPIYAVEKSHVIPIQPGFVMKYKTLSKVNKPAVFIPAMDHRKLRGPRTD
jgi:hypothetical protein